MNFAIYANQMSRLVGLVDGNCYDMGFVYGGWRYSVSYMHRTLHVVGTDFQPLVGSPLGSAYYPLEAIAQAIVDSWRIIHSV
jgi:hypothetical protein